MILTKAFITKIPIGEEETKFQVRIPAYEDGSTSEAIFDALLCTPPGTFYGYNVGDCVYVQFEDDETAPENYPVILGKLYTGVPEESATMFFGDKLTITDTVNLPKDTKIDGTPISQTIGSGGGSGGEGGGGSGGDVGPEIEEINKKIAFHDWVIEEDGDRLNFYRKYFRNINGELDLDEHN